MRTYLIRFMEEFDYPAEARAALLACFDKLMANDAAAAAIRKHYDNYAAGEEHHHTDMLNDMTAASFTVGTPWQTAHLLICLLLTRELKKRYDEKGIPEDIWRDTVGDFKWKLFECHKVYHVWGSFVAFWWSAFFAMRIFAVGRLQYELCSFGRTVEEGDLHLTPEMKALSIHIPSAGPLTKELREDSYRRAKAFFADYFGDGPAIFMCHSWLLYPGHEEMLPPTSNIVDFMHDFTKIEGHESERSNDLWRIFDDSYVLPYYLLPRNTTLRRAYAERLCAKQKVGSGFGYFVL